VENDVSKQLAEKVFSFIEPFAGYGFNRSHAACYAMIGYQTAYLKAHYPAQFMAALLNSDKDDTDRIAIEIEESRNVEIEVLPPDVNESFRDFAVIMESTGSKPKIRFGLEAIKGVGHHIAEKIIEERKKKGKYKDIVDLMERVQDKDLNKKSIEALAMSGALDGLIERNKALQNVEILLNYAKDFQKNASSGQSSLFSLGGESAIESPTISLVDAPQASKQQKLSWEKQLLGLYVSDHPLYGYQDYFAKNATPIHQLSREHINQTITVGGIITKVQKVYTRNNQLMHFIVVEDGIGKLESLIFPKVLEKTTEVWVEENIILMKGRLSEKDGELKLLCENGFSVDKNELKKYKNDQGFDESKKAFFNNSSKQGIGIVQNQQSTEKEELTICIGDKCGREALSQISSIICNTQTGKCRVFIISDENDGRLETPYHISYDEKLIKSLRSIVGKDNVQVN
jgi:DNA polymerase-3 subunit alpha